MSAHPLPFEEKDYSKWPDSAFQALTPEHVRFFNDESLQEFNAQLQDHRSSVDAETRLAFERASYDASRRQLAALDEVYEERVAKIEELVAKIKETEERLKEVEERRELKDEYSAAQDDDCAVLEEIDRIRDDPDLSPDERARELADARAKRASILANVADIENRLDERGWLPARTRQRRAGPAASASTAGIDPKDAQRREMDALRSRMGRHELPWKEVLGRAMCEQVVNAAPPSSSGSRHWGLAFQRIGHWADFASSMNIGGIIGNELSIDAGAFRTQGDLDASENEKGCAMLMYARSGDPLLQHVFGHRAKPFGDVKVSLKFEYVTVVSARPDQMWLVGGGDRGDEMQPLLVHEHKSPAAFPGTDENGVVMTDLWNHALRRAPPRHRSAIEGLKHVVEQAYGYMVILGLRYGAISTTEFTWFLKRDDDESPGAQEPAGLLVSSPYKCTDDGMKSLHTGYLTALLHAMDAGDAARNQFPAPGSPLAEYVVGQWRTMLGDRNQPSMGHMGTPYEQKTFDYLSSIKNGSAAQDGPGGLLPLHHSVMAELLPVPYDKAYERVRESSASSVQRLRRPDGLEFIIKTPVVGASGGLSAAEAIDAVVLETSVYAALFALQGSTVPPLVYGGALISEEDGGWHAVITLDVGTSLDQLEAPLSKEVQTRALAALARVHAAGCLHGDVALRNFVLCPNTGAVRVIDFARAELVDVDSVEAKRGAAAEMADLRGCLGLAPADVSSQSQPHPGQASSSSHDSA